MSIFEQILIYENEKASAKEIEFSISLINKCYNEWRKIRRRINAVDIITTTTNRIIKLNPKSIEFLDDELKMKLSIIMMRCMDNPRWKPIEAKEKIYKKLYPLIKPLENYILNTGTGGSLKEIIMTRLSASLSTQNDEINGKVMVCYEPHMSSNYLNYLFGEKHPDLIYKMKPLTLPEEFSVLKDVLEINLDKAYAAYLKRQTADKINKTTNKEDLK